MCSQTPLWHGVARDTIPWFPTVDRKKCIGCELCFVTCGRGVFEMRDERSFVLNPFNCMVGCTTCANLCPAQAITFPEREVVQRVVREHKIMPVIREEAVTKRQKGAAAKSCGASEGGPRSSELALTKRDNLLPTRST